MARFFSLRTWCAALLPIVGVGWAALVGVALDAQAIEPVVSRNAVPVRLYEAEGTQRRLLDRFQRYLIQEQWEDVLEIAAKLLQDDRSAVVAVDGHRFVSLGEYVHQHLAKLPHEVLAEYRGLVDSPAEAWYRQGIAKRDQRLLQRVVDEFFCSHWGDEALFALGEFALEQGEYQAARRHWSRISRELQFSTEETVLVYPDTNLDLAEIRARLVLVSLYEGDLERAKNEIEALDTNHGNARGQLGGQEVVFVETLTQMLQQADSWQQPVSRDWPTFAGSPTRTSSNPLARQATYKKLWSQSLGETTGSGRRPFPIVQGNLLLYRNALEVVALRLNNGERVFVSQDLTLQSPTNKAACDTLSGNNRYVFGTTSSMPRRQQTSDPVGRFWGIDLQRDGALSFQHRPEKENVTFVGAPVVVGDRLWVTRQSRNLLARVGIVCFDLASRKQVWQRWLCREITPASGRTEEVATGLLTYDSGVIYSCTNLGAIAAIRASDGQPLWIATYDRASEPAFPAGNDLDCRIPNPCVSSRGMLFAMPTDSQELLALDAATGIVRWRHKRVRPESKILGVASDRLLMLDDGLRTFDLHTGEPDMVKQELDLLGHPVIVSETLYWPIDQSIQTIEIVSGNLTKEPLQLPEPGGANLLVAGEYLVAAGRSQLTVYQAQPVSDESPPESQLP